jgi:hypothetical protein
MDVLAAGATSPIAFGLLSFGASFEYGPPQTQLWRVLFFLKKQTISRLVIQEVGTTDQGVQGRVVAPAYQEHLHWSGFESMPPT